MRLPKELPRPTTQTQLDPTIVSQQTFGVTLYAVGARLERALAKAGYSDFAYFQTWTEAPGFALVTRMERVEDDGRPKAENQRFMPPGQEPDDFDLTQYLSQLLFEPTGFYRLMIFRVASESARVTSSPMSGALARRILESGEIRLRADFASYPYTPTYSVDVFVYEFERKGDREVNVLPPVRLPARLHLDRSGIDAALLSTPAAAPMSQ